MPLPDIDAARKNLAAPPGKVRGLPNACYTDPDYHRLEARSLFARTWTCVGVGADIPEPGDVKPVVAAGAPIILVRDREGGINVFHNVCSHRGVQLAAEPQSGRVVLRCPYHSWTYGLDGALVHTPMIAGTDNHNCPELNKAELGLRRVRDAVWNDLIFVDLSGEAAPIEETLGPLDARWAAYDFSKLRHAAQWELELNANWKLAIENFLEAYHLPWIHPALTARSPLEAHKTIRVTDRIFGQTSDQFAVDRLGDNPFPPFPGLTPDEERAGEYPIIFPNVLLGLQRDHFYAIIVDPLAENHTRERVHLYVVHDDEAAGDAAGEGAAGDTLATAIADLAADWKEVFAEDVWVVERMQTGRASDAFGGGVLTPLHDDLTRRFMQQVAEMLPSTLAPDVAAAPSVAVMPERAPSEARGGD